MLVNDLSIVHYNVELIMKQWINGLSDFGKIKSLKCLAANILSCNLFVIKAQDGYVTYVRIYLRGIEL